MTKEELISVLINSNNEKVRDSLKLMFKGEKIIIAFTGALPFSRMKVISFLKDYFPVIAKPDITKETNLLIVGDNPGLKLERAKRMGITIWGHEEFSSLLTATDKTINDMYAQQEKNK